MRILLPLISALFGCVSLYAQGSVNFSNRDLNAPVFNALTGENAVGGTTFSVALYFALYDPLNPIPPDESSFAQLGASTSILGPAGIPSGLYFGNDRIAFSISPGVIKSG